MILSLSGVLFTLIASTKKSKFKPEVEFDDLASGLNIDLGYYLNEGNGYDKGRWKREELAQLLNG